MVNDTVSVTQQSKLEQEFGDILKKYLNPPLKLLADRAYHFLHNKLPPEPSIVRALAAYFELFAHGYTVWDDTYDYHLIHEYYYGAYLQAIIQGGESLTPQLQEMLENFTKAMIDFTWCENALICNDPQDLLEAASGAINYTEKASELLVSSSLGRQLKCPIKRYLDINLQNFLGLKHCAEIFLAAFRNEEISLDKQSEVDSLLSYLEKTSPELASELRGHYTFAQRFAETYAQRSSDLYVKEGKVILRALGYLGEDLVNTLFDHQFEDVNAAPEEMLEIVREQTGLPIVSVEDPYMPDIFETILGEEYLAQKTFELSTNLTFSVRDFSAHDGERKLEYTVEEFQVRVARFGSISVEFSIPIKDVSVSHVRLLESLISPHAGRFDFIWQDAPSDIGRGTTNYVDHYLKSQEWINSIRQAMHKHKELSLTVDDMGTVLKKWEHALGKLATRLPRLFTEPSNKPSEHAEPPGHDSKAHQEKTESVEDLYKTLHQECFLRMRDLAHQWIEQSETVSSLEELVNDGKLLYPQGVNCVRFGSLMDIAEEVLERIHRFLKSRLPEEKATSGKKKRTALDDDIRQIFWFDRNTGWAAILPCRRISIVERDGRTDEANTEWYHKLVFSHPEFKGLIIQSREARAGLYDWLFVATPPYRNLATIRSHETDMMCIGENRAFLYLPDEPAYLIKQYVETNCLMQNIRTLVLAFNAVTRGQLEKLEPQSKLNEISEAHLRELRASRNQIEDLRMHAEKILDLLRSCTISKYQDHSDLLKEMIKESRVNDIRDALEHNIEHLGQVHTYLTDQVQHRFDEGIQAGQRRLTWLVAFLTLMSAFSAIPVLGTLLGGMMGMISPLFVVKAFWLSILHNGLVLFLLGILLGCFVVSLIVWLRGNKT